MIPRQLKQPIEPDDGPLQFFTLFVTIRSSDPGPSNISRDLPLIFVIAPAIYLCLRRVLWERGARKLAADVSTHR